MSWGVEKVHFNDDDEVGDWSPGLASRTQDSRPPPCCSTLRDQSHPVLSALGAGNSAGPTNTPASHGDLLDVAASVFLKPSSPPPRVSEEAASSPVCALRLQLGLLTQSPALMSRTPLAADGHLISARLSAGPRRLSHLSAFVWLSLALH